ncbi:MAG: hypothetical protein HYZ07_02215 [Candidatus Harrisonbacteria bacterium]|nr:hypothetical protein [Candidatus Harrisonbacteria bacterium]MBI3114751.1 hypothetical protein [Candidatus Harrisonbacteria bacterium]
MIPAQHTNILKFVGMLFGFIFFGVSRDFNVATLMLPAPRLALPGPSFIGIMKTALGALI